MVVWAIALLLTATFCFILLDILWYGLGQLSWEFFTQAPANAGRDGGINSILVSTGLILLVCLSVSIPLGIGTAIFLAEFSRSNPRFSRWVRRSLNILAGVPSIVFGLFGYAFFVQRLGLGFSILSGGLTLACMVLPMLIRAAEEGFRSVPDGDRLGAASLGLSRWGTLGQVLLPSALPGLVVGLVLGIGRAMAETAALIFTSGYVDRMPGSVWDSGRSLSIHIFDLSMNVPGGEPQAYGSALVLPLLLIVINSVAGWVAQRYRLGQQGR